MPPPQATGETQQTPPQATGRSETQKKRFAAVSLLCLFSTGHRRHRCHKGTGRSKGNRNAARHTNATRRDVYAQTAQVRKHRKWNFAKTRSRRGRNLKIRSANLSAKIPKLEKSYFHRLSHLRNAL